MNPLQVADELRRIALSIDSSVKPRSDLVGRDLIHILAAVGSGYKATILPEGPGSQIEATGGTAEEAIREAFRQYFHKALGTELTEEDLDDNLRDVWVRNGAIYYDDHPIGDVGPA